MRKRKSPILLISILSVAAAVAIGTNYISSSPKSVNQETPPPQAADDVKPVGEPTKGESASNIAASVRGAMNTAPSPDPKPAMPGPGMMNNAPSMATPQKMMGGGKPEKPKPNTSATSAQWYNDESALSGKN